MIDDIDAEAVAPPRDILTCVARWSRSEKGYIEVRHPTTGEVAEIPYSAATDVWKEDIARLRRGRGA